MEHFIKKSLKTRSNFTYWHRGQLEKTDLLKSAKYSCAIEVDLSFDYEKNIPFVGHPKEFYTALKQIDIPSGVDYSDIYNYLTDNPSSCIVIDCKDKNALPYFKTFLKAFGTERIAFSAFVKEFSNPRPPKAEIEPHWIHEEIPLEYIRDFQEETNTFWIGIIRGYSPKWLKEHKTVEEVIAKANKTFHALGIYLPRRYYLWGINRFNKQIAGHNLLPVMPIDLQIIKPPFPYIGITNFPQRATNLKTVLK